VWLVTCQDGDSDAVLLASRLREVGLEPLELVLATELVHGARWEHRVGRWGSRDPWLGIPVTWDQVSGAQVIVEAGLRDFKVTPSQGSHFFQNLTAFNIGYFTINADDKQGLLDWAWLDAR